MHFNNKTFDGWYEFDSACAYSGMKFHKCDFLSCSIGLSRYDLSRRARISEMEFKNCSVRGCMVKAAFVEDVVIDVLKTYGDFDTWGAVFSHVTLKGKIGDVMLSPFCYPREPLSQFQLSLRRENEEFYSAVDWALDIKDAEFKDFDCRGVPSRLVRRDPETQVMVTRQRVLACGDGITAGGEYWHSRLKLFLDTEFYTYQDAVFVAPKRNRRFKELVVGLQELRRCGVAEPD